MGFFFAFGLASELRKTALVLRHWPFVRPGFSLCPIGNTEGMLFFSLVFILLKLKINFGRVTRGYVLAKKKQFSLGSEWKVSDHWGGGAHGTETGWFFKNRPVSSG